MFFILPMQYIQCFYLFLQQIAITELNRADRSLYMIEKQYATREVETYYLNKIQKNFMHWKC
jgi:intergrase/recombinase